ncbi:Fur family transcriptional regulator [Oceanicella actignis]|uniref:Fur family transcriptional regulator, zinc uptake regulator n=1 Tax=Oceanicella actignis TaxID=1189325 RepID=A0A1M7S0V1_9RHOB|nr:Fur family transcriptional regulator [Oceanicella actignis]SES93567.1 Fur family transcriptional regulator, zinc uptake regulator [Oceanicella actignis]SHN51974.1 Fur family transcriptional regulator, zinc uptake regulator [Oceanicella actignis]
MPASHPPAGAPPARSAAFRAHDHEACRAAALRAAQAACAGSGAGRLTPARRRVLEILLESHAALGAYEILDRLRAEGRNARPPAAYRALDFLVAQGLVHRIERLNAFVACAFPGRDHAPAFLVCRACRRVAETAAPGAVAELDAAAGRARFALESLSLEAEGLCPECAPRQGPRQEERP